MDFIYDYIIVGGGIAGMYANYLLSKKHKCLLLEAENMLGGRAVEVDFHGHSIKTGAGIGAPDNKHLLKLLDKLKIKYAKYPEESRFLFSDQSLYDFDINEIIKEMKRLYKENEDEIKKMTVKEFIIKYFGTEIFNAYQAKAEYTDFHNSDVEYYMKYYPIEDDKTKKYDIIYLAWSDLIEKLRVDNEILNFKVCEIKKKDDQFYINNKYKCKKVILAITVGTLSKIKFNFKMPNYKKYLAATPFLRLYTYHKKKLNFNLKFTTTDTKLKSVLKIDDNILMAAYNDSKNALSFKKYLKNKAALNKKILDELKKIKINPGIIDDVYPAYWDEGIHYFKPTGKEKIDKIMKALCYPNKNIFVVGEMVSYRQGWVEGAIESVDRVIK